MTGEETISEFVSNSRGRSEPEMYSEFIAKPHVTKWLGSDLARHERLKAEFHRIWSEHWGTSHSGAHSPRRASPDQMPRDVHVEQGAGQQGPHTVQVLARPIEAPQSLSPVSGGNGHAVRASVDVESASSHPLVVDRRELYLCTLCKKMGVFSEWDGHEMKVICRSCGTHFSDLLSLIPVIKVSPLEYYFGAGPAGVVKAAALAGIALAIYAGLNFL
ncbi:MAG: hypothetical protein HY556_12010 [Euryarchaeota archaeon]|nr:hypothetical protein [Euryarchaeota archaeon]